MPTKKSNDGVFWKREAGDIIWTWRIGSETSKKRFFSKTECAMDYIERYVEKNPNHKEVLLDKTWNQIFRIFGISIP